jgi:outer membrane autotransporter protein
MPLFGGTPAPMVPPPSPPSSTLPPYEYPASASGWLSGAFTSTVWSIYGEGGLPIVLDADFNVTPFLGVRYMDSSSGAYNETGSVGGHTSPALHVTDAYATSIDTYLGAELSGQLHLTDTQVLMPSLRVAWVHDFNNNPWQVDAWFSGVGSDSAFSVNGGRWAQDSALINADFSLAVLDNMIATIGYQGNINATQTTNTLMGRVDIKF